MSSPNCTHAQLHLLGRWLPLECVLPVRPLPIAAGLLMAAPAGERRLVWSGERKLPLHALR